MTQPDPTDGSSAPGKAMAAPGADNPNGAGRLKDPLGVAAIVCGCIGLVVAGLLMAIVTGVLAATAGAKAREQGRPLDNAYIALVLAALDGVVWLLLQFLFELPALSG